jgi:hypothetical protein
MISTSEMRRIEVQTGDPSVWQEVTLGQLTKGDVIRMFEPDGTPVVMHAGEYVGKVLDIYIDVGKEVNQNGTI